MSLETVVEDIREEARARAKEIRVDSDERAEEILAEAERDADDIREEAERDVDRAIEQEREQRLSSAKLESKQARLEARREVLEEVRDEVESRVAGLEGDEREELTRALLEAAAKEFEDAGSARVHGRDDDEALLSSIVEDYDGFEVGDPVDCLGGVVVESDASRVRVNNTFDSVLDDVWDENLREISATLFEE